MDLYVFTCRSVKRGKQYDNPKIKIVRSPFPLKADIFIAKGLKYLMFNIHTLVRLMQLNPDFILYYEPHSALPVYWYYRIFKPRAKLFIHYHEYYSPEHYKERGMAFAFAKGVTLLAVRWNE